jgi:ABC-type lipoprotein release transport system permease subunit
MWHFLALCWRDLWRNRRRTILVGVVIIFAVSVMVFFIGLGTGGHNMMIHNATDSFLGQVQLQHLGYQEEPNLEHQLTAAELAHIEEVLPTVKGVTGWSPRLATGGLISKKMPDPKDENDMEAYRKMTSEGALIVGIDPVRERPISTLESSLRPDEPGKRCVRGCSAARAEIFADSSDCETLCEPFADSFSKADCAPFTKTICADRCDPEDEFCYEEDCREKLADYCLPARFIPSEPDDPQNLYRGEVVLGSGLANVLDVGVGDRVAVMTGTSKGRSFASLYRVSGLVKTGSIDINRTFALTHYDKLSKGLELEGQASFVVLALDDVDAATAIAGQINELIKDKAPEAVAMGWAELSPELDVFVKIDQGSMLVMLAMLVAIIGVILANVVTMSVMERTREYGVRLAVGESHSRIVIGLIVETTLLALFFSLLGAAIGEALNFYYQTHPIDFGMGEFETTGIVFETKYTTAVTLYGFLFSVGTVVFFSVLGSIYPALRVRKLKPVDALRFV